MDVLFTNLWLTTTTSSKLLPTLAALVFCLINVVLFFLPLLRYDGQPKAGLGPAGAHAGQPDIGHLSCESCPVSESRNGQEISLFLICSNTKRVDYIVVPFKEEDPHTLINSLLPYTIFLYIIHHVIIITRGCNSIQKKG
eukprot:scaffold24620_cov137-Cylindrotheca_fusiformis.AAC.2